MRPLIPLVIVLALVAGTMYVVLLSRSEKRTFNAAHAWTMYSRPLASQGWEVGIERERYQSPPLVNIVKTWPDDPPEMERLDYESQAILQAVRFNENHVGG